MPAKTRHLFVIDPIKNLNLAWDTTIKLAFVLHQKGAEVFCTQLTGLVFKSHPQKVSALSQQMIFGDKPSVLSLQPIQQLNISVFDCVHMRKEPPFDLAYMESLWILGAASNETKVINSPQALQQLNEKMMIAKFSEFAKPLIVSSDPQALFEFAMDVCQGDVVIKPLNLFGGRGVLRLNNPKSILQELIQETGNGNALRLMQKFEPKIKFGEVRAFAVGGEPIAWCLKTPSSGEFLANTRAGSSLSGYTPTEQDINAVTKVSQALLHEGVYVAGFDLIDGHLSEVNITCPALLNANRESLEGFELFADKL